MKRLTNATAINIEIKRNGAKFLVLLERIKNSVEGCPRFKATLIDREQKGSVSAPVYTFRGHYMGEADEARWIVERYLEEIGCGAC